MAHNFALRARKLAWSFHDDASAPGITSIRRVGTDSTLNDDDRVDASCYIRRISASDDIRRLTTALKQDGCVIVHDFTDLEALRKVLEEVRPRARPRDAQLIEKNIPLIKQSSTIRNEFYANASYQQLCDEFLTVETKRWKNDQLLTEPCKPILSSISTRRLQTGESASQLFRHDAALGVKHTSVEKYQQGRDKMLGLIVPGTETIHIHVALGSHLCGNESPSMILEDELEVGEALIVLGSLHYYVAAQTDRQEDAEPVLVYDMWSCAGVYRPEEQTASMISAAEANTYPSIVQERLR